MCPKGGNCHPQVLSAGNSVCQCWKVSPQISPTNSEVSKFGLSMLKYFATNLADKSASFADKSTSFIATKFGLSLVKRFRPHHANSQKRHGGLPWHWVRTKLTYDDESVQNSGQRKPESVELEASQMRFSWSSLFLDAVFLYLFHFRLTSISKYALNLVSRFPSSLSLSLSGSREEEKPWERSWWNWSPLAVKGWPHHDSLIYRFSQA